MTDMNAMIESKVVGNVLNHPSLFPRACLLDERAFSDVRLAEVWKAIKADALGRKDMDFVAFCIRQKDLIKKIGGQAFLEDVKQASLGSESSFNEMVDILFDQMCWRRIQELANRLSAACQKREESPTRIMSWLENFARKSLEGGSVSTRTKSEVAESAIASIVKPDVISPTGIDCLDLMMQGGLQKRRMYAVGSMFGRGKTVLMGTISENLNTQGIPHLFLSLEMPPEDIEIRSLARRSNLNSSALFDTFNPDYDAIMRSVKNSAAQTDDFTYYDYAPQATIDEIIRKILTAKSLFGIEGFILDYWQLIRGKQRFQSEESHMTECADRLAAICRQENIWGLVAAQVDDRGRLRKSDALYQSASLFLLMNREENSEKVSFVTTKSNFTRYMTTGSDGNSGMVFDLHVGPHVRNAESYDHARSHANDDEGFDEIEL